MSFIPCCSSDCKTSEYLALEHAAAQKQYDEANRIVNENMPKWCDISDGGDVMQSQSAAPFIVTLLCIGYCPNELALTSIACETYVRCEKLPFSILRTCGWSKNHIVPVGPHPFYKWLEKCAAFWPGYPDRYDKRDDLAQWGSDGVHLIHRRATEISIAFVNFAIVETIAIIDHACAPLANCVPFRTKWNIVFAVKHRRNRENCTLSRILY